MAKETKFTPGPKPEENDMDTRPPNCNWPHCADYDERCMTGINIPCVSIIGQNLQHERRSAGKWRVSPAGLPSALAVAAILADFGWAVYIIGMLS